VKAICYYLASFFGFLFTHFFIIFGSISSPLGSYLMSDEIYVSSDSNADKNVLDYAMDMVSTSVSPILY
jgi:hypothetical protein